MPKSMSDLPSKHPTLLTHLTAHLLAHLPLPPVTHTSSSITFCFKTSLQKLLHSLASQIRLNLVNLCTKAQTAAPAAASAASVPPAVPLSWQEFVVLSTTESDRYIGTYIIFVYIRRPRQTQGGARQGICIYVTLCG